MDNEIDIKYINSHDGNDRVVGPNYSNSKAYVALSEYERLQEEYERLQEEYERLQEENERNQEAASNYKYQCMVHEECRRDLEEKYAQAIREKEKWEQVADRQDAAITKLKARLNEAEGE